MDQNDDREPDDTENRLREMDEKYFKFIKLRQLIMKPTYSCIRFNVPLPCGCCTAITSFYLFDQ